MKARSGGIASTRRRRHAVYGTTLRRHAQASESADSQLRDGPLVIQIRRVMPAGRDEDSGAEVGDEEHRGRDPEDAPPIVNSREEANHSATRPRPLEHRGGLDLDEPFRIRQTRDYHGRRCREWLAKAPTPHLHDGRQLVARRQVHDEARDVRYPYLRPARRGPSCSPGPESSAARCPRGRRSARRFPAGLVSRYARECPAWPASPMTPGPTV